MATIIGVLSFLIFQQGHEIRNQGLSAYLNQLVGNNNNYIIILHIYSLSILFFSFNTQLILCYDII